MLKGALNPRPPLFSCGIPLTWVFDFVSFQSPIARFCIRTLTTERVCPARRLTGVTKLRSRASALILTALLFSALAHAADDILLKAKGFLDANNPQAAYNLLAPLQSQRAGDPDYDYLLGVSALDLGKNTEAVFALERVLAVRPDHAAARAQIARAYFALKETEAAKREFENVKK